MSLTHAIQCLPEKGLLEHLFPNDDRTHGLSQTVIIVLPCSNYII